MTKKDLRNGMIVETRNGNRYLVHNERFVRCGFHSCFNNFNNNLTSGFGFKDFDIMKVYGSKVNKLEDLFESNTLTLLWEREEDINVGDIVEVINPYAVYMSYDKWIEKNVKDTDLKYRWDIGKPMDDEITYKVLTIAKHDGLCGDKLLAYVENLDTFRCYLVALDALKKVK